MNRPKNARTTAACPQCAFDRDLAANMGVPEIRKSTLVASKARELGAETFPTPNPTLDGLRLRPNLNVEGPLTVPLLPV